MENFNASATITLPPPDERFRHALALVKIEVNDGRASFTGEIRTHFRANGRRVELAGGQIQDYIREKAPALAALWDRWHLNDMRAGCEHQRAGIATSTCPSCARVHYSGAHEPRVVCCDIQLAPTVGHPWRMCPGHYDPRKLETCDGPRYEPTDEERAEMHAKAMRDLQRDGVALVGLGRSYQCAADMVSKPCPVCGYKFGTAWLREELPEDFAEQLAAVPGVALHFPATT